MRHMFKAAFLCAAIALTSLMAVALPVDAGSVERVGFDQGGGNFVPGLRVTFDSGAKMDIQMGDTINGVTFTRSVIMGQKGRKAVAALQAAFGERQVAVLNKTQPTDPRFNPDWDDRNGNRIYDAVYDEDFVDANNNGQYDPAESFTDVNQNGSYDPGEAFVDANGSGLWDDAEAFTDTNGNDIRETGLSEQMTDESGGGSGSF